eukprot:TRINITY_DN95866_c0_g1_i1.p1 TRINITY_DN95866_c0_g1~~TRINITY_DN95866_c0_g1_i1.p1  ORF type:complete len:322 (-),score=15.80 TRINITY_DN95866_c0_g1_i1:267-1232(-)
MHGSVLLLFVLHICIPSCVKSSAVIPAINTDPANPKGDPTPKTLTTLGAKWTRVEFKVLKTDNGLPGAFKRYDQVVDAQLLVGIHTLLLVDYQTLEGVPSPTAPAADWEKYSTNFAARVGLIVQHYGHKVTAYEIWNEPDDKATSVPPQHYGPLLEKCFKAIKAKHTNATVVLGGLNSGDPSYISKAVQAAGGLFCDAVGLHPYGRRPTPNWPSPTWGFGALQPLLAAYNHTIATHNNGKGLPMWLTEYGTNDLNVQGTFPEHMFEALNGYQPHFDVPILFWFCWSDGMVNPFGLTTAEQQPKPSYHSFYKYAHSQPNYKM